MALLGRRKVEIRQLDRELELQRAFAG